VKVRANGAVGVSENVIEASWLPLADTFEYKLFKDAEASPPRPRCRGRYG